MNIFNTIKRYITNGLVKIITSLTTDYNVYVIDKSKYLDEIISDNSNWIQVLKNFCQPLNIALLSVADWNLDNLKCTIVGNTCYLQGRIYHTGASSGEYNLPILPYKIRPNTRVDDWSGVIISGVDYKTHITLSPDNSNLQLYFYDEVPTGLGIPINLSFVMTTDFTGF